MVFGRFRELLGGRRPTEPPPPQDDSAQRESAAIAQARLHLAESDLVAARAVLEPFAGTSFRLDTLMLVSRIRVSQGEVDAALELLDRALSLHPHAAELLETAAEAHEMKRQSEQVLRCWQAIVFGATPPSARQCVQWMRAFARAAKDRRPQMVDQIKRVVALLERSQDVDDQQRLAFVEWQYTCKAARDLAVQRYQAISPARSGQHDVRSRWLSTSAWCTQTGTQLYSTSPLGDAAEPVTATVLHEVLVVPAFQWIPIVGNGEVALSDFAMHRMKLTRETSSSPCLLAGRDRLELRLLDQPRRVDSPAVLVGGMAQYYHQTIDFLSVLAVVEELGLGGDLPLVVNQDLAPFQREQLRLLGYGDDRLITVGADEQVLFRELVVPTRLVRGGQWMHPLIPQWYRRRLAEPRRARPLGSRLYVSRRMAPRRRIANEEALKAAVQARGYEVVHPEDLTMEQQIALFGSATHLVTPAGAALASMVFMPSGGSVVVPVTQYAMAGPGDVYFDALAQACGHRFAWLPGRPVQFHGDRIIDADFEIDLQALEAALDAAE